MALLLAGGPASGAKSYTLPEASVEIEVRPEGSVDVSEHITFDYDGEFQGAWRDFPSRFGEQVLPDTVEVSEAGQAYEPGGSPVLGESGPPGTFATTPHEGGLRVVWRYRAENERRTFTISYRMTGAVQLHRDTAELNMRVWGDQWATGLGRLEAAVRLPGPVPQRLDDRLRVWGHPREVDGSVSRLPGLDGASLQAVNVPDSQWVELRMLFPRELLADATEASEVAPGGVGGGFVDAENIASDAFDRIVAEEMEADVRAAQGAERLERVQRNLGWLIPVGILVSVAPAFVAFVMIRRRYGRDPEIDVPEYVREPPSDDSPALVGALVREGGEVSEQEFLATFFDLLRRGFWEAAHETTEKKTWLGMRTDVVSDLRITKADLSPDDLPPWERIVYDSIDAFLAPEGTLVSEFGRELKARAKSFHASYSSWRSSVKAELGRRKWIDSRGRWVWAGALGVFFGVAVLGFAVGMLETRSPGNVPLGGLAIGVPGGVNVLLLLILGAILPRSLTHRSTEAAALAAGWEGLRRYLDDFSAMQDAPPASLVLWERLLVYGIVLGVADRVLAAAQVSAPAELGDRSRVYWIDNRGGLGGGLTSLTMHNLMADVGRAVSAGAPKSSGSGFGGGFGGGGGGGRGGGGGGAW